jgi:uncharacterized protein YbjQ (UPF0145 family)
MRLFNLFGSDPDEDAKREAARERQEASQRSLKNGGLPLNAVDRLREQAARQGTPGHIFTSDLSVNELSLVGHAGYEPLGQIMGSSIYHVGMQWRTQNWRNSVRQGQGVAYELDVLTQAFYNARHLALGRLQQEAALLGATGVVGVRLERKEYEWGAGLLEFAAIGTAIREAGSTRHTASAAPFICNLSGQDFWLLRQGGYRPAGLALGNCTYYQIPRWTTSNITNGGIFSMGSWQNMELPDYTQALYDARELAMTRMTAEARAVNAEGIVGADVDIDVETHHVEAPNQNGANRTRLDMIYHFTAVGTAIVSCEPYKVQASTATTVSLKPNVNASNKIVLSRGF